MSEVTNTQTDQATETPEKPNLTLQDLTLMVQILQVGTSRGSWKADELSSVGGLYDRITSFLAAAGVAVKKDTDDGANNQETKE